MLLNVIKRKMPHNLGTNPTEGLCVNQNAQSFESKDDQIVDVCQFIPVPILIITRSLGGTTFIAKPKPRSGRLSLSNVAFNIDGKWFLASPEPIAE